MAIKLLHMRATRRYVRAGSHTFLRWCVMTAASSARSSESLASMLAEKRPGRWCSCSSTCVGGRSHASVNYIRTSVGLSGVNANTSDHVPPEGPLRATDQPSLPPHTHTLQPPPTTTTHNHTYLSQLGVCTPHDLISCHLLSHQAHAPAILRLQQQGQAAAPAPSAALVAQRGHPPPASRGALKAPLLLQLILMLPLLAAVAAAASARAATPSLGQ